MSLHILAGYAKNARHDDPLSRPFVRVELAAAVLRDEQPYLLLAVKRRIPQA